MRVIAHKCFTEDLKPGDLFSIQDQLGWDEQVRGVGHLEDPVVGMKAFIRTDAPCPPDQMGQTIYRLEVQRDEPEEREEAMP